MKHKNSFLKRVWADVSLDDIKHNYSVIRKLTSPGTKIMAIVKADGYGHGAVQTSRVLSDMGADLFGVSNLDEARQL
ncbi:MAG: alanine racemase, partial [Clostridia bacterium]|nr:alanine racemase [Clostridia bacterium]